MLKLRSSSSVMYDMERYEAVLSKQKMPKHQIDTTIGIT